MPGRGSVDGLEITYFVGIDVGTQGSRALAIDESGSVVASGTAPHEILTPRPSWVEQRPEEWWEAVKESVSLLSEQIDLRQVAAMGLTGQMHGSVFLDADDEVIRPALLWNDQRTVRQTEWMTEVAGDLLLNTALNPAIAGFQAPKIIWLREEEPENYARVAAVLLPKDYVRFKLTGSKTTDVADASGTLVLDVAARRWSPELLDAFDIPAKWMPGVLEGPDVSGHVTEAMASQLGLPAGIPVAAGGGDNAAAAVGNGIVRPGIVSSSIGTSGVVFAHSDSPDPDPQGRLHTMCHSVPGKYHHMGAVLSAGGSFRWLRDAIFSSDLATLAEGGPSGDDLYDRMAAVAAQAPVGSEGLVFLPYLTGERTPHMDSAARGAFVGLTIRHESAHLVRAVMEGVVFALRDSLEIMKDLGISVEKIVATGGGARNEMWLRLQADILGAPIWRMEVEEGPAYGAALLGAVSVGAFGSVQEAVDAVVRYVDPVEPDASTAPTYARYFDVYRSLYPVLRDSTHRLGELAEG